MKIVADDLYEKMGGNFQNTTIIFPNKRASLFFSEYLWEKAGGKTLWAPEYTTISDLFASLSRYTHADPIYLALRLFETFKEVMQSDTKSVDQAYPLMEMMLSDFQDIDNNMVDPEKLFVNIADLKEMTDFSFLADEQRDAIERFFGHFLNRPDGTSKLKSNFMAMWNNMTDIYKRFRASLLNAESEEKAMVYEGMMKRLVIDDLTSLDEETMARTDRRLASSTYVVIGFNVLNKTEMELFKYLKNNRDTKFYWDYDEVYTRRSNQTKMQSKYEAGQFILEDMKVLGSELSDSDVYRNMRKPKEIAFIQSPTDNAQARYVNKWIKETVNGTEPLRETAVILCDENLLQPVLHSMPEDMAVNITMGYPLANTPVFSLVQALIELQTSGTTISGAWRYKQAAAVLRHPLIHELAGKACGERLRMMTNTNMMFPGSEVFADDERLRIIFRHVSGEQLADYLIDVITLTGRNYQHVSGNQDFNVQMQKEAIFTAYTRINRLRLILKRTPGICMGNETLSRLIMQLLSGASIPFHGEPASGLQVMGLLETRNLDFRNIIMLSVSEGQMPKSDKRPSLIPYTLRAAFGMTTIEREVSLYAYYYYRLMQRADKVTMMYNSSTDGGSKGEMSRFMLQTLAEASELLCPGQKIDMRVFAADSLAEKADELKIEKTGEVMERLYSTFNENRKLSPSALKKYMKCPLQFYFRYVAGLSEEEDVSDDIDNSMFGTIFHHTMQKLYEPYRGCQLDSSTLKAMRDDTALVMQKINNAIAVQLFHYKETDEQGHTIDYAGDSGRTLQLNGTQLINRHVIREFVQHQLEADTLMAEEMEKQGGGLFIIDMETEHNMVAEIECNGVARRFLLGGYIDRTDCLHLPDGDRIRIVDYKTGSKQPGKTTIDDLFDKEKCSKHDHIFQTFYYSLVLGHEPAFGHKAIAPALMYCSTKCGKNHSGIVKLDKNADDTEKDKTVNDFNAICGRDFQNRLFELIRHIFSNGEEDRFFTQCDDEQNCAYCDFLSICQRHPSKRTF